MVRRRKRSLLTRYLFPLLEGVGHAVGIVTFLFSLCLYGFGLVMMMDLSLYSRELFLLYYMANWLVTNFVSYVIWDFSVYFNPFLCCAPPACVSAAPAAASAAGGGGAGGRGAGQRGANPRDITRGGLLALALAAWCGGWALAGRCLRGLAGAVGLAQWQVERLRARDRLLQLRSMRPDHPRARPLSRASSKPKLLGDIKKWQ